MDKFKIIEKLGVGTYSTVYKVKRISDEDVYALKKVKLPKLNKKGNASHLLKILTLHQRRRMLSTR